jgi:hypothetical protein
MQGLKLAPVQISVFLELFFGAGVFSGAVFLFFSVRCFSKNRKHRTPAQNPGKRE